MLFFGKIDKFYREVKAEVQKISWPSKRELVSSAILVVVSVLIVSLCCLFVDFCSHKIIQFFLKL
ncbi:MAG: preprotein translocase subunit SecE [Rickettsiaceae bacterium]|nr:preprotein translocase subunit SecE [Rickettsiaceae bacterium]